MFFDTSALIKLFVDEDGSEIVRGFEAVEPTKYTTDFCFYEALTLLKVKHLYRKEISKDQYNQAVLKLVAWHYHASINFPDVRLVDPATFNEVQRIMHTYNLDASDSLQIISVKHGFFSTMIDESKTILVTADKNLASAARTEGLRVWDCMHEPAP